jgi:hypothetical protein
MDAQDEIRAPLNLCAAGSRSRAGRAFLVGNQQLNDLGSLMTGKHARSEDPGDHCMLACQFD